jgi:hypothetical protein
MRGEDQGREREMGVGGGERERKGVARFKIQDKSRLIEVCYIIFQLCYFIIIF